MSRDTVCRSMYSDMSKRTNSTPMAMASWRVTLAELCAVIGMPHPKWDERPLLLVKLKPGQSAEPQEFLDHLDGKIARWWMPDEVRFVDDIPLGPTGKIDKKLLRERFGGVSFVRAGNAS